MSPLADTLRSVLDQRHLAPAGPGEPPVDRPPGRYAAVAAILLPRDELLFMRRAEHPGDPWSGHVCFPGGRGDPEDAGTLATAIRETREELGLDLSGADVLGALSDATTAPHLPPLVVRPWVFRLDRHPALTPNHEVASVHTLGVDALLAGVGRSTFTYEARGLDLQLPCVDFDGVRLWGMTLWMVDDLLRRLR